MRVCITPSENHRRGRLVKAAAVFKPKSGGTERHFSRGDARGAKGFLKPPEAAFWIPTFGNFQSPPQRGSIFAERHWLVPLFQGNPSNVAQAFLFDADCVYIALNYYRTPKMTNDWNPAGFLLKQPSSMPAACKESAPSPGLATYNRPIRCNGIKNREAQFWVWRIFIPLVYVECPFFGTSLILLFQSYRSAQFHWRRTLAQL